jgi:surfeit locus 1 family protein
VAERTRFPLGLTLAAAIGLAILIGLGVWQLRRLSWKEALLAKIEALQDAPARPLTAALRQGGDLDFVRVEAACPGLGTAPFVEIYSMRGAGAGGRLVSACPVDAAGFSHVLVDRGFVADTISARPPVSVSDQPVTIVGVLRKADKASFVTPPPRNGHYFSRDLPAIAAELKAPAPAPYFLMAETSTNPEWKALDPSPLPNEIANRHLEYALTWFGLAAALVGVYAALLWRRGKA